MGTYTNLICSEQNPYTISSASGTFRFAVTRKNIHIGSQNVIVSWSLNGSYNEIFNGNFDYGETKAFTISKYELLIALNNTSSGTLTIRAICNSEVSSETYTVKIDAAQIKSQFTANPTVAIQSTPIRGYLISGYSTARVSYSATKGTGASQMLFDFSVAYGVSGSFNPSSDSTSQDSINGHTDLTLNRRDTDIDFVSNIQVTDSRGQYTDRRSVSTTWKGYTLPQITVDAFRCDAQGNRDDSGDHVSIMFSGQYSLTNIGNVGHVSLTVGSQTYTDPSSPIILSQAQNVAKTYTIIATDTVLNSASETVRKSVTINMAKFPLDLYDDGHGHLGARVGTIAEPDYFSCGLKQKGIFFYGTCATARATARKVCNDADQTFQLYEGVLVFIKFTYANGKANPTLNINGTGAIAIRRYGTTAPSTSRASSWNAGSVVAFIYDGTYYQMVGWINTTYSTITQAEIENSASTTARLISGQRFKQGLDGYFKTGTYVYDGASTDTLTFTDSNMVGKTFIICGTQDAGNPVLRASLNSSTGGITAYLSGAVTRMRINYICY